jgi:hypothetical protein
MGLGQSPRPNATNTRDALAALTGNDRLDASAVKNLPTVGGTVAWTNVSGTVTVAATGGRLSVDASTADAVIKLPPSPVDNTEVSYQISDVSANNIYLEPATGNTIGTQAAGYRGKHNPAIDRSLIETLRYVSGRWLPYFGRLVYEAFVVSGGDPYDANVVFFAMFEGANNSTTFTDVKGNLINVRSGTPKISTAQSMFGNGSLYLDGLSSLTVPAAPSFVSGTQEFEWEIALYPTVFLNGNSQGLLDHRITENSTPESINIRNQDGLGTIEHSDGATRLGLAKLKLNQWQILRISRYQGIKIIYLDDVPIYAGADTVKYVYTGNLTIGDIVDASFPFSGSFTGYIQYIRKTIGSSRKQGYGTDTRTFARPPLTDADPLNAFKVLDINCDTGSINDSKGHTIAPTGAVAVSNVQKRAGSHSIALTGGCLNVVGGTDFNFGSAPYSIHASGRFTSVGTASNTLSPNNQYFWDFDSGDNSALLYTASTGTPIFCTTNNSAIVNQFNRTPIVNSWYDVMLAKVDTKYLLVENNQIVAASNNAPTVVNLNQMRIGAYNANASTVNGNFQGFIDSVSAYKNVANGSNLTHSYPLRFLVRFSEGSATDELGAVGTIVGTGHTYDSSNKRSLESSALFAGNGHISYPANTNYDFGSGGFEIAGWTIGSTVPITNGAIACGGVASGAFDSQSWIIYHNIVAGSSFSGHPNSGKLCFFVFAASNNTAILTSTTSFVDGLPHSWRIIKYIVGGSAATVLIVDDKIEDVYLGNYTIAPTIRSLIVGNDVNAASRNFKGNLDDIAIYKA